MLSRAWVYSTLVACSLAVGCSAGQDEGNTGSLGSLAANLSLPSGLDISSLSYVVRRGSSVERAGDIDLEHSSVADFRVGDLPLASDYRIALSGSAVQREGGSTRTVACAGWSDFALTSTSLTTVDLTLTCGEDPSAAQDDRGDISAQVDVVVDAPGVCPVVSGIDALPSQGTSMNLVGYSSNSDFSLLARVDWQAPRGVFSSPNSLRTDYVCADQGAVVVTFSLTAKDPRCAVSSFQAELECGCLSGSWDHDGNPATACVPAITACPSAPPIGQPIAAADLHCEYGRECCCNGCAPSTICDAQRGQPLSCYATDFCFMPQCGPGSACQSCREAHCRDYEQTGVDVIAGCFTQPNLDFVADPSDPSFVHDCSAAVSCAHFSHCATATSSIDCYCGGRPWQECEISGPSSAAVCATPWQVATRATDPVEVFNRLSDLHYPSGWATFLLQCEAAYCADVCL